MHPFAAIVAVLGLAGGGGRDSSDTALRPVDAASVVAIGDPGNVFTHGRCSLFAQARVNIRDGVTKSAFVRVRDSTKVPFAAVKFWGPRGVVWGGGMPDYLHVAVMQGNVMDFRYGDQYWNAEMAQCKYSTVRWQYNGRALGDEMWRDMECSFDC